MKLTVNFVMKSKGPAAEAEVTIHDAGVLSGVVIRGISIWISRDPSKGKFYATFPSRSYDKKDGTKGHFDFIVPAQGDYAFKNWIISQYERSEKAVDSSEENF